MDGPFAKRLVSDELWQLIEPVLPPHRVRAQGGGLRPVDDRAVFTAIVYVLTTGCAWRSLPPAFGVSKATAHRRFGTWTTAGLWDNLEFRGISGTERDWLGVIRDAAATRAVSDHRAHTGQSGPSETAV
jgi:transposase